MAPPTPALGRQIRIAWTAFAVSVVGLGLLWVWPPAAVAVCFLGAFVAMGSVVTRFAPGTRWPAYLAAVPYGVALYVGSGSLRLAAAGLVPMLLLPPTELEVGRFGYKAGLLMPAIALVGLGLFATAWPTGWWGLGAAPPLLFSVLLSLQFLRGIKELQSKAPRQWPATVGQPAPVVRGTTRDGAAFDLEQERGRWVMLCFLRGDWCAICQIMMRVYKKHAPLLAQKNVKIVAVSPSGGPEAVEFARELGLDYTILVDGDLAVTRAFGAVHAGAGPDGSDTPLPVSFLIDPEGVIRAGSRADDVMTFQNPLALLAHVR